MVMIRKLIKRVFQFALSDEDIRKDLEIILSNVIRNENEALVHDLHYGMQKKANESSVKFLLDYNSLEKHFSSRLELLDHTLNSISFDGLILEFGVYQGESINYIAKRLPNKNIFGFDSFEGLQEPWHFQKVGLFKLNELPKVENNVKLIKGYFEDTLNQFLIDNPGACAFIHIDSDLYSSAKTIFNSLRKRIVPNTIIAFDEFFNFPNWERAEFLAFSEFLSEMNLKFEIIGYTPKLNRNTRSGYQLAVKIIS